MRRGCVAFGALALIGVVLVGCGRSAFETREPWRAQAEEAKRDHALKQDPYFDYSEALLQIAIVLISVAIVAEIAWLAFFGGALGIFGGLLMLNGYTLLVDLPFIG